MRKFWSFIASIFMAVSVFAADIVWDYSGYKPQNVYKLLEHPQWVIGQKKVTPLNRAGVTPRFKNAVIAVKVGEPESSFTQNQITVYFDFDSAELRQFEKDKLKRIATENPSKITITGYTDDVGSKQYNFRLGLRRAQAVSNYLKELGVAAPVTVKSKGKCCFVTEKGKINRKKSRRAEVIWW